MRQQIILAVAISSLAMASMGGLTGCYSKPAEESKPAAPAESSAPPAAPAAPPAEGGAAK